MKFVKKIVALLVLATINIFSSQEKFAAKYAELFKEKPAKEVWEKNFNATCDSKGGCNSR